MELVQPDLIGELGYMVSHYGVWALVPILMLEGSIMAIGTGVLAGANVIGFWQSVLVIMIADFVMTHVFYIAGLETTTLFNWIKNKFEFKAGKHSRLRKLRTWATKRLQSHFVTTYTAAKFIPLPYTTITVTILAGALGIQYRRLLKLLLVLVPIQAILFTSIGYFSIQGFFYELTVWRLLGLALVVVLLLIIFGARQQLGYMVLSEPDED